MAANVSDINTMDDTISIVRFLQRPVKLDHFKLDVTPPPSAKTVSGWKPLQSVVTTDPQVPIVSYALPGDILSKGSKLAKTMNHYYFKADVHIKLTINTNPFVAGRFYLTYSPYEDFIVRARQQLWASRAGVTAYPGVEIDVQLDNSVEIVIPFASYKEAYVLTKDPENYVRLFLFALTPVLGNKDGNGAIDFTVYAWFENITLNMPTSKLPPSNEMNQIQPRVAVISDIDKRRLKIARALEKLKVTDPTTYKAINARLVQFQIQAEVRNTIKDIPVKATLPAIQPTATTMNGPISDIAGMCGGR